MSPPSRRILASSILFVLLLAAGSARANDSMVRIDAGGIELISNDSIRMVREDLYVSREEIRVDYVFANQTPGTITATIGFPLPAITEDLQLVFEEHFSDLDDPKPDFVTRIDGKDVASERRLIVTTEAGENITALLQKTGFMPPATYSSPWSYRPASDSQWALLEKAAVGAGIGPVRGPWRYQLVYIWNLEIAGGASIDVQHRYHPWIGGYGLYNTGNEAQNAESAGRLVDAYCLDGKAAGALVRDVGNDGLVGYVSELGYIVKTGANWAGPIGRFRLTVEPPEDGSSMMTCWPMPAKKLSRDPIVFEARDFTPTRDLLIGFFWKPLQKPSTD